MNITIVTPATGETILMTNATWFGDPEVSDGKVTGLSFTAPHANVRVLREKAAGECCHEVGSQEFYIDIDGRSLNVDGETLKKKLLGRTREAKSASNGTPILTSKQEPKVIEVEIYETCGFELYDFLNCNNALTA